MGVSSIVQAVAEASEGRAPSRIDDATCERVFRCPRSAPATGVLPQAVILSAGRGGGKTSALLAPKAVHAALTVSARQEAIAAARGQLRRGHADAAEALVLGAAEAG